MADTPKPTDPGHTNAADKPFDEREMHKPANDPALEGGEVTEDEERRGFTLPKQ